MTYPMISIVTPSLNQGQYLERCIQSVLQQQYPNFEHIIVDAGSEDETPTVLRKYAHLRWLSEPDSGQAQGINKGFAMARGEIMAWLNSDDEYNPGVFFDVAEAAERTHREHVIVGGVELTHQGVSLRVMKNRPRSFFRFLNPWIPHTNISQPGVFFPRSVLQNVGHLDERLHYVMDYDLLCRLLKKGTAFQLLDKVFAKYNLHSGCKMARGWHCMYPELDEVILNHSCELNSLQKVAFIISFVVLRPVVRKLCKLAFPAIY